MPLLRAGTAYFALVFGAGFVLGTLRVLFLVPRLGVRTAELLEAPLMLLTVVLAARHILRRFDLGTPGRRLGAGGLALGFMLLAELGVALTLERRSFSTVLQGRDPVSGSVYLASLLIFGLMPFLLGRTKPVR